ncbi:hypothetical protein M569_14920, partial [Genlisea aurea]
LKVESSEYPDFIISTPDCLISCIKNNNIPIENGYIRLLKLIIDDVDQMLLHGNEGHLNGILRLVRKNCQRISFFNGNGDLNPLKKFVTSTPYIVTLLESGSTKVEIIPYNVSQYYISCVEDDKLCVLFRLWWTKILFENIVVFTNAMGRSYWLKHFFEQFGVKSEVISLGSPSTSHQKILDDFKDNLFTFLIVTDDKIESNEVFPVAISDSESGFLQRIENVKYVINFDMPDTVSGYVFRINRNGK